MNQFPISFLLVLILLFHLSACGGGRKGNASGVTTKACIVGGSPAVPSPASPCGGGSSASDPWESTVALVSASKGSYFCSGVLVHPQIVLTAAHCLPDNPLDLEQFVNNTRIHVGQGREGGFFEGQFRITKAQRHPDYLKKIQGRSDTAILLLENPLPNLKIFPSLWKFQDIIRDVRKGTKVTLVGFGRRDNSSQPMEGVKYQVESKVVGLNSNEISIAEKGKDTCNGDSGGPAFVKTAGGDWALVGITSRGPDKCGIGPEYPGHYGFYHQSLCFIKNATGIELQGYGAHCIHTRTSYPDEELERMDFLEICQNPEATEPQKHTVFLLKELAGEQDCHRAYARLLSLDRISLANQFVSDITPLLGLHHLEGLDIRGNHLDTLRPLLFLPQLKTVQLELHSGISVEEMMAIEKKLGRSLFLFDGDSFPATAATGRVDLLRYILEKDPSLDINRPNQAGQTALSLAVQGNHQEMAEFLLKKKALPLTAGGPSSSLLTMATSGAMAEILLRNHPELAGEMNPLKGQTPLMIHARRGNVEIVDKILLYERGPSRINDQDYRHYTALMYAQESGSLPLIKLLCGKGARKDLVNDKNLTVMDLSKLANRENIYQYLLGACR